MTPMVIRHPVLRVTKVGDGGQQLTCGGVDDVATIDTLVSTGQHLQ